MIRWLDREGVEDMREGVVCVSVCVHVRVGCCSSECTNNTCLLLV